MVLASRTLDSQQRDKDDVFLNVSVVIPSFRPGSCSTDWLVQDRRFEQLLASNVTDMPYVWNVTQPVGTIW